MMQENYNQFLDIDFLNVYIYGLSCIEVTNIARLHENAIL